MTMHPIGMTYEIDHLGFLKDFHQWDENFAETMAKKLGIAGGLTIEHWEVINFIRDTFQKTGRCPTVFETAKGTALHRRVLKRLFPTGYLRGACLLSGVTYREGFVRQGEFFDINLDLHLGVMEKEYRVDVRGFLMDAGEWDEAYAVYKAHEMKIPGGLTREHFTVLNFLRENFEKFGEIPTVYETCENLKLELDELEKLFPDGYHRGAVKLAGLKLR